MLAFRRSFTATMARVAEADVLILTLGLVEAWYDTASRLYLNAAPPRAVCERLPARFELHVLDYQEILATLVGIHGLLERFCARLPRILITVSPVPLASTFRDQDVLVANSYSKAVQRAAVEAFVRQCDADYFPSYEFVTLSDPEAVWGGKDYRHVRPATVDRIMGAVLQGYVGVPEIRTLELLGETRNLYQLKRYAEVEALLAPLAQRPDLDHELLYRYGLAKKRLHKLPEALAVFERLVEREAGGHGALENALRAARSLGLAERAAALAALHEQRFTERAEAREQPSEPVVAAA